MFRGGESRHATQNTSPGSIQIAGSASPRHVTESRNGETALSVVRHAKCANTLLLLMRLLCVIAVVAVTVATHCLPECHKIRRLTSCKSAWAQRLSCAIGSTDRRTVAHCLCTESERCADTNHGHKVRSSSSSTHCANTHMCDDAEWAICTSTDGGTYDSCSHTRILSRQQHM